MSRYEFVYEYVCKHEYEQERKYEFVSKFDSQK